MLPDIQDELDTRGIELDEVGIAGIRYPTTFTDGSLTQAAIAEFAVRVRLPADRRGTHMSRMVEIIHDHLQQLDPRELAIVLKNAAVKLDVDNVTITASLPFAVMVTSPSSERQAWQPADVRFDASLAAGRFELATQVTAQVTSLCPCSKAISDYGAHNQRSDVTISVRGAEDNSYPIPVLELVEVTRSVGSSPVFPIVKRPDERAITMAAFDHPAFVEDMVRDASLALRSRGAAHSVSVRNFESIHSHDAIACVSWSG